MREHEVRVRGRVLKELDRLPDPVQNKFSRLLLDLREKGPFRAEWPNYGKLGPNKFHCHLNQSHVACWTYEKDVILIEVYYAGSRQNAPY
jgi:hypothetical protein